ncbi:peptidoglycan D,D-transpeptidase FtsI family protein [Tessaracoccus antarcticus]|uniref:Penicillin-binding protein 2 n=1 Tax=Tessaracoccus antarcticus TaxID=2479848 RepID=A0A3M0GEU8_9ACTN|nr:penicillin-binding protein 2 [Tessaracoccus antarcticus]RMB59689.1 penicillin-binding protein 2 [Tessaracoccus antarcticus]
MTGSRRPAGSSGRPRPAAHQKPTAVKPRGAKGSSTAPTTPPHARRYRRSWQLPVGRSSLRIRAFMVVMALLVAVCVGRAFQLQAIDAQAFAAEASSKMQSTRELPATRGTITDRNGVVLAATEPAMRITVDPDMVASNGADKRYPMNDKKQLDAKAAPGAVARILAKHLGGQPTDYLKVLQKKKKDSKEYSRYEIVAKQVPASVWSEIQADMRKGIDADGKRPLYGLFAASDPMRTYPNGRLASNVLGFVNAEGKGVAGLEGVLEDDLDGEPGQSIYDSSRYGRIPLGTNVLTPPIDGVSYETTLDSDLQWLSEQALADGMATSGAKTGIAIVLNVKNGQILALANGPSFDPSELAGVDAGDLGNRAVTDAYEPGSVQKVLTIAALADAGLVTGDTEVVVPPQIASGGGFVRDAFSHGTINLTTRGIIAQSSNIGTIDLARRMPKDKLSQYLKDFGLGSKPNSGLPGETSGSVPGGDMADYTRDQISFGQGLSVSAVQMSAAVASVVNGGVYHQPTILKSATRADGTPVELPQPVERRVVSEKASAVTLDVMEAVIAQMGNGKRTIPGYRTAGKSGTSQRFDPKCKCYNGYTASFVGVAPAEDPQLLVYVVLDQPKNGNLGSQLALPVVNNILQAALPRYNVLPSTTPAPERPLTFD